MSSKQNSHKFYRRSVYAFISIAENLSFDCFALTRKQLLKVSSIFFSGYNGKYDTRYHRKNTREMFTAVLSSVLANKAPKLVREAVLEKVVGDRAEKRFKSVTESDTEKSEMYWNATDLIMQNYKKIKSVEGVPVANIATALFMVRKVVGKINRAAKSVGKNSVYDTVKLLKSGDIKFYK